MRREADATHAAQVAALEARAAKQLEEAETRCGKFEQDHAAHVDTVRREADAKHAAEVAALEKTAQQREAEMRARARTDVERAEERLAEVERTLAAIRKRADRVQAEVERLHAAEHPEQREQAGHETPGQREPRFADSKATPAEGRTVTRRGMARLTGAVVLAGVTGTVIGWVVALSRLLY